MALTTLASEPVLCQTMSLCIYTTIMCAHSQWQSVSRVSLYSLGHCKRLHIAALCGVFTSLFIHVEFVAFLQDTLVGVQCC